MADSIKPEKEQETGIQKLISQPPTLPVIKEAVSQANRHFLPASCHLSLSLLISIAAFVPFWVKYIRIFGVEHWMTTLVEALILLSLQLLVLFMLSIYLFNKTHPPESTLKLWPFTKKVTWPWCVEGVKASVIVLLGCAAFLLPGIVKAVHYTFVSFVVFFNRSYQEGKVSALKRSRELARGFFWWIVLIVVLFQVVDIILSKIKTQILDGVLTSPDWVLATILGVYSYLSLLTAIYVYTMLYTIYARRDKDQMIGE